MVTLLVVSMLTLAFNIQLVKAEPTTIIVPDDYERIQWAIGNASDGDTIFVKAGTYYERVSVGKPVFLIGESRDTTIIDGGGTAISVVHVTADNVNISSFTIQNRHKGVRGIWLDNCTNSTVSGNNVRDIGTPLGWEKSWGWGIALKDCNGCTVERNNIDDSARGIELIYSQYCRVYGNRVNKTSWGISINSCHDCVVVGNTFSNNIDFGIRMFASSHCVFKDNSITGSDQNFGVAPNFLYYSFHDIDASNTISGKPIVYLVNEHNITVNPSTYPEIGYLAVVNSTNITVKDLNFSHNGQGVLFAYTSNSIITGVSATHNEYGIDLLACVNCTVSENTATNNNYGIRLRYSPDCVVTENIAISNNKKGITLYESPNCVFSGNQEQIIFFWMEWWFWTIVVAGVIALAGTVYFLKKRKPPTAPTPPEEGTV